jgi:vacuolar-type H+-ATPase catalytic subunit A/Vma1
LTTVREIKQITYKGKAIKITADFSTETWKATRAWSEKFWALNESYFSPRIFYPAKLSLKIDGVIKIFHDKQKVKQYMITKPPLLKILQGILHTEDESKQNHERMGSFKPQEKKRQIIREQHWFSCTQSNP